MTNASCCKIIAQKKLLETSWMWVFPNGCLLYNSYHANSFKKLSNSQMNLFITASFANFFLFDQLNDKLTPNKLSSFSHSKQSLGIFLLCIFTCRSQFEKEKKKILPFIIPSNVRQRTCSSCHLHFSWITFTLRT